MWEKSRNSRRPPRTTCKEERSTWKEERSDDLWGGHNGDGRQRVPHPSLVDLPKRQECVTRQKVLRDVNPTGVVWSLRFLSGHRSCPPCRQCLDRGTRCPVGCQYWGRLEGLRTGSGEDGTCGQKSPLSPVRLQGKIMPETIFYRLT